MRKLIFLLLLVNAAYGQVYQSMPQYGYGPIQRMQWDSVMTIPLGITSLRQSSSFRNVGQLRFNQSDSSIYVWSGFQWIRSSGGSNIIAGNQLVRSGDTLGLRSSSPGASNALWFNPNLGSFAAGFNNVASGINSVAFGSSKASDDYSFAIGNDSKAEGSSSIAMGISSTASGYASVAMGASNTASGYASVAMGENNTASAGYSVAMGQNSIALEQYSMAMGQNIQNPNNASLVIGDNNNATNNVENDVVFQVARNFANRFEVHGNGQLLINDGTQQSGYVLTSDANGVTSWQAPASGADSTIFATQFRLDSVKANRVIIGSDAELRSLHITGTNGNGKLELRHQASLPTAGGQTTSLYANSNGNLAWKNDNLHHTTLATNHITADRSYRFQNKSYTLADSADVLNRADSTLYTTPHDLNVKADSILSLDDDAIALTTLGMSAKFISANRKLYQLTSSLVLTNGFYQGIYFTVKTPTIVTGVRWLQVNTGNYTAGTGFNGIGLYRYNSTTDSLEIIRETASEPNIWQRAGSANSWQSAAFTSPVTVQPGVYYIGWNYNNSAQTTAPSIGHSQAMQTG